VQDKDTIVKKLNEDSEGLREYIRFPREHIAALEKNFSNSSKSALSGIVKVLKIVQKSDKKSK
jgi:hypothetical protein